jgi:hypothetical protein
MVANKVRANQREDRAKQYKGVERPPAQIAGLH